MEGAPAKDSWQWPAIKYVPKEEPQMEARARTPEEPTGASGREDAAWPFIMPQRPLDASS